jgi:ferredoxin-NADP reductase
VQRVPDGEVSSYLVGEARDGDTVEVRGPDGGWFVWQPADSAPMLLVGSGSGVVPLMPMIRSRGAVSSTPFRLIYSVRTPEDRIYDHELRRRATQDSGLEITFLHTSRAPAGEPRPVGRITSEDLLKYGWPPEVEPTYYVCGLTPFVETVADLLIDLGHKPDADSYRTFRADWPMIMR